MADRKKLKRRAQFVKLGETNQYNGVRTTLFPNGEEGEIWVSDGPLGVAVKISKGSRGLSVTVRNFASGMPLSCNGEDSREFTVVQYHFDHKAQAFKLWYELDAVSPLDSELTPKQAAKVKEMYELGKTHAIQRGEGGMPTKAHRTKMFQSAYERGFWAQQAGL